jgi:glycosyltransferase involved in cell wall biosynthesis
MNLLHIAGAFAQHPLYSKLVVHLSDIGYKQTVYVPVRSATEMSRQPPDDTGKIEYQFRHILQPVHRLFFRTKIRKIYRDLLDTIDHLDQFDLIHAHTLYSDGAVALKLHMTFNIPYVIAVRNTDLNVFRRFRPDLRWLMHSVLRHAGVIVFLSPAYQAQFLSHLPRELCKKVEGNSVVLGNGLESFWFENKPRPPRGGTQPLRLLYVGDFSRNKNVEGILNATAILARRVPLQLTLVGGGGSRHDRVVSAIKAGQFPFAAFLGRIDDRERLRDVYGDHDIFVMPSIKETFGVVYLEALSQGLPIVHSYGQGLDGYFPSNTVSEPVDPLNVESIAAGTEKLANRLDQIWPDCRRRAHAFNWHSIATQYDATYRAIVTQQTA